jgi:hypothetical protein
VVCLDRRSEEKVVVMKTKTWTGLLVCIFSAVHTSKCGLEQAHLGLPSSGNQSVSTLFRLASCQLAFERPFDPFGPFVGSPFAAGAERHPVSCTFVL